MKSLPVWHSDLFLLRQSPNKRRLPLRLLTKLYNLTPETINRLFAVYEN
nr:MAG TPA: hypothetical protein [Caudoviricetes sp.]